MRESPDEREALRREDRPDSELVSAIRDLTEEIRALRGALPRAGSGETGNGNNDSERLQLRNIVQGLVENLDELEADNVTLRAEVERLASHHALSGDWRAPQEPFESRVGSQGQLELIEENARLRESLSRSRAQEGEALAMLRVIDSSRAWKVVSFYWALARRLGRGGGKPHAPNRS
jgi:hypothetical protein